MTFIVIVYLTACCVKSFNTHKTSNNTSNHEDGFSKDELYE